MSFIMMQVCRRTSQALCVALLGGVCFGTACLAADPIVLHADTTATGGVDLLWSSAGTGYVYGVEVRDSLLSDEWRLAPDIDQWPVESTNWTAAVSNSTAFYRIRGSKRGRLVSWDHQVTMVSGAINTLLFFAGLPTVAVFDVSVYEIVYETFDHRGLSALASGALMTPLVDTNVPFAAFQHGTEFLQTDAPSNQGSTDQLAGILFASTGYATVMPDYLGMGTNSPPLHPYLHARSEAIACVDMLRAGRHFIASNAVCSLNGQLFIAGYSQGGHATLALQRELEMYHTNELPLTASAPMAGPYDMSGTMTSFMTQEVAYASPAYLAYVLFGLDAVYDLFDDPGEVFVPTLDTVLPPMFRGTNTAGEINAVLPPIVQDALQPAFVSAVTGNVDHPLRVALRANDLWDWAPATTTRLYHCAGDTIVPIANSQTAFEQFVTNGSSSVVLVDPMPSADHGGCFLPSVVDAKAWFDSLVVP